jgi:hypothetical protein
MGPLSGKQQREWAKHHAKEARESAKMESEESRKQQLHEIKLQETAAKANQGIGHKEELHGLKVNELGGPLGKSKRINRQKIGLPSQNPLAGTEVFGQGQRMLPKGTDTVPAMLTPGEAVIPRAAAQDPKNKPLIKQMVQEGRKYAKGTTGVVQQENMLPIIPKVMPKRNPKGYADGTTAVPNTTNYYHTDSAASMSNGTTNVQYYDDGIENVTQGIAPYGFRYQNDDPTVAPIDYSLPMPKGNGYMGNVGSAEVPATEYTLDDNKGQYPSVVPTLSRDEVATVAAGNMTPEIVNKAALYRDTREANGQSPFADRIGLKVPVGAADDLYKQGQPPPVSVTELSAKPATPVAQAAVPAMQDDQYNPDVKQGAIPLKDDQYNPDVKQAVSVPFPVDDQYNADVKQWAKGGAPTRSITPEALKSDEDNAELARQLAADKAFNNKIDAALAKNDKSLVTKIIEDAYGDSGIFNRKDLVRFALTAGGSMALGYNPTQALRYAGRDVLAHADKRNAQQEAFKQQEARDIRSEKRTIAAEDRRYEREIKRLDLKDLAAGKKQAQAELEKDQDQFLTFAKGDVPPSVRAEAVKIAHAKLKDGTQEEQIAEQRANFRRASELLAVNHIHRDPNASAFLPKWETFFDKEGRPIVGHRDRTSGHIRTTNGDVFEANSMWSKDVYDQQYEKTVKNIKAILPEVQPHAKDKATNKLTAADKVNTGEIAHVVTLAAMDTVGPGRLSPAQFSEASTGVIQKLQRDNAEITKDSFDRAYRTEKVLTLHPTDRNKFNASKEDGKFELPSSKAAMDFGNALKTISGGQRSDSDAFNSVKKSWEKLSLKQQQEISNLSTKGYSPMMEFGIYMSDPKAETPMNKKLKRIVPIE